MLKVCIMTKITTLGEQTYDSYGPEKKSAKLFQLKASPNFRKRYKPTGEEKELFIEYVNLWGIICGDLELCSYKEGFRHGAKFACDVFS